MINKNYKEVADIEAICRVFLNQTWEEYKECIPNLRAILLEKKPILDHLAIIDLPSKDSGISILKKIFGVIGYIHRGSGYLPDKINDFVWLTAESNNHAKANEALPQIVCGDFRLELLSKENQRIIQKYISQVKPFDFEKLKAFCSLVQKGQEKYIAKTANLIFEYINTRPWSLPSFEDYHKVNTENPLIGWVLLFGRKVNHFGLSTHLLNNLASLSKYNNYLKQNKLVEFNASNGEIKGDKHCGIEQSSSLGRLVNIKLDGGIVTVNDSFIELVWRHSKKLNPIMWADYYTDFIAQNANHVVESLFIKTKKQA